MCTPMQVEIEHMHICVSYASYYTVMIIINGWAWHHDININPL